MKYFLGIYVVYLYNKQQKYKVREQLITVEDLILRASTNLWNSEIYLQVDYICKSTM